MQEIILSAHIHSVYSDGLLTPPEIAGEAARCGLDVILMSDHNVFPLGFDGYYDFGRKKVLLLTGEEIHDQTRQPQKNHLLAFGIHQDFSRLAQNPQALIDAIAEAGGLTFLAHAYDPAMPMVGESDLSWVDWNIHGFTGLELWNNLSELKIRVGKAWQLALYALLPQFMALEPPAQIRAIWDDFLANGQRVVALGGVDAHTLPQHFGPIQINVFPYRYHFRTIRNHVLLESELSGNAQEDERAIMQALREGHAFISNDMVHSANGFRFCLDTGEKQVEMGGSSVFRGGLALAADIPAAAECRLLCNGKIIDRAHIHGRHRWPVAQPGVYRLECYRRFLGRKRGWIFSNAIAVTP
jgi:hypothetical protein